MRKSITLKNIEKSIIDNANYQTEIDYTKKKYMAVFPYPYLNGKLHLGHAFTMLKVDFEARWKAINNYNVLFPFGFHCTGIPIYAAAKKLEKEISTGNIQSKSDKLTQYDIMKNSGITEDEIKNFIDPYYWVKYFPNLALDHIQKLGVMVDKRRSFVTTDINPFYDSFIKWQFNKLYEKGYLKFGTRNSIYSPTLDIQCQDHDRSKGESVQTSDFKICEISYNNKFIWIPYEVTFENQKMFVNKVNIGQNINFNLYHIGNKQVYMTEYVYNNYSEQHSKHDIIESNYKFVEFDDDKEITLVKKFQNEYSNYLGGEVSFSSEIGNFNNSNTIICMSTDIVIDRLDTICIVKPIPQWYIDYANPEWKKMALDCISEMKLTDTIKSKLITSINWLKEWGVSRTFGLGTKLPVDDSCIIDSLSDSTIYPAYYTIAHMLHEDIYGKVSKYNPNDFTNEVWDYIFLDKWSESITLEKEDLDKMNESFKYFYPVDVRISGKDLIPNHLCMYIFNHTAIFDKKNYPISINCNGWIMVNNKKMAKSNGNFITIESATQENSVDAVRFTLAESGDGIDDANYSTVHVEEHNTLKLYTFYENIEKFIEQEDNYEKAEYSPIENIFNNVFNKLINDVVESYNTSKYKMVISNGFHIYNNLREKYRIFCKYYGKGQNYNFVKDIINKQLLLLNPIIPHITEYLYNKINKTSIKNINFSDVNISFDNEICNDYEYVEQIVDSIREKVDRLKKKKKPFSSIKVSSKKLDELQKKIIMEQIKNSIEFVEENITTFSISIL
jgi:leucyl-tRNA synthetase